MMNNLGGMMWGMGLVWLIILVVLVLAAAALVKYLFFRG
jgi:flagellar basal body-associated protein FliL